VANMGVIRLFSRGGKNCKHYNWLKKYLEKIPLIKKHLKDSYFFKKSKNIQSYPSLATKATAWKAVINLQRTISNVLSLLSI